MREWTSDPALLTQPVIHLQPFGALGFLLQILTLSRFALRPLVCGVYFSFSLLQRLQHEEISAAVAPNSVLKL